ncbi:MAG: hypothetical protein LBH27_01635, partial [Endomicrobium sp.]|nr:hypothetical protein [Endomicrobium sp.]
MKICYTLIALLFFAFFCTRLYASYDCRISSVSIDGLKNVNLKNVLSVVNLKNGKYYSKNDAKDDAISIINLGYFSDIKIYFNEKTGNLTFKVTEKPLVERINFVGNLKFSTFKLKSISKLKRKKYYDFLDFEATKKKIEALYIKNGYSNCKVELSSSIDKNTNKITVTFFITENNKIFVAGININGCNYFNEKKILKIMKTKLNSTFKEDIYQVDLKSIESLYKNNGFVDYRFISLVSKCNDTAMFLTFNIYEGNRYKIRSVICNGNFAIDKKKMNELIKIKENEIFNKYKIKEIENDIKKKYYDKGYLNVIVKSYFNKIDVKNNFLDVFFLIDEGKIFYFGNLYINGLVHTKDKVLRREMLLRPG